MSSQAMTTAVPSKSMMPYTGHWCTCIQMPSAKSKNLLHDQGTRALDLVISPGIHAHVWLYLE